MKTKQTHTPGPWHCKTMRPKYGGWSVEKTRHIEVGKSCDALTGRDMPAHDIDSRIALVLDGCTGANAHAEAEANARLISAAPDQNEQLNILVCIIEKYGQNPADCVKRLQGQLPAACAAIAKAEGR